MNHLATQKLVNDLLGKFRNLVVEIEDENKELNLKLKQLNTPKLFSTSTSSSLTATSTNPLTTYSSRGTLSSPQTSSTNTTNKPPPYKSAVRFPSENNNNNSQHIYNNSNNNNNNNNNYNHHKNNNLHIRLDLPPKPPIRRRRRSNTDLILSLTSKINDMNIMTKRGALIVLEGLDRVGKSTLAKKLVEHLEKVKKPVAHFRFPDRSTPIGQLIDNLLKDPTKKIDNHAMHLLFSANRWELDKQIRQTIFSGTTVIVDRYSYSGIAYSCAKGDLDANWCLEVEKGLPRPDLIIYLELKKEFLYKRPGFGDERFEVEEFQELIRNQYDVLIQSNKEPWLRVSVENKGPEQVLGEVILPVKRCLESCEKKPLDSLEF